MVSTIQGTLTQRSDSIQLKKKNLFHTSTCSCGISGKACRILFPAHNKSSLLPYSKIKLTITTAHSGFARRRTKHNREHSGKTHAWIHYHEPAHWTSLHVRFGRMEFEIMNDIKHNRPLERIKHNCATQTYFNVINIQHNAETSHELRILVTSPVIVEHAASTTRSLASVPCTSWTVYTATHSGLPRNRATVTALKSSALMKLYNLLRKHERYSVTSVQMT